MLKKLLKLRWYITIYDKDNAFKPTFEVTDLSFEWQSNLFYSFFIFKMEFCIFFKS